MTRIVAHRGLHRPFFDAPENSLSSMQAAWSSGIAWGECDIRFSRDDTAMVIHDAAIERSGQQVMVAHLPAAELHQLAVPPLADILAAIPADCGLLIEPKTRINFQFLHWLGAFPTAGQTHLHTFHLDDLPAMADAGFSTAAIVDKPALIELAIDSVAAAVHVDQKILDVELMMRIRHAGKSVGVWTVNEPSAINAFIELGVDTLITDNPLSGLPHR
jgi:glycerophosphoryl diester phosphodiesterase